MSSPSLGLGQWLDRLQCLHPQEIDLGLERVSVVAQDLALNLSACKVVTIAGTNGKGSTVAALEAIALRHGWSVASYTSPHLLQFNERVRIDGQSIADDMLCRAFAAVDACRKSVSLTYFEFTTLAALYCLQQYQPHLCILEVGLGGRLDAVNIIDADITVVTNIQLDHQDYLGADRETIALEKAGIFRAGVPAICAEYQAPSNLRRAAREVGAHWFQLGHDFDLVAKDVVTAFGQELEPGHAQGSHWCWTGVDDTGAGLEYTGHSMPQLELSAVAAAIQAACLLIPDPEPALVVAAVTAARLSGRCQMIELNGAQLVLDVAHNPAAITRLVRFAKAQPVSGDTHLLLAVMRDKAAAEMIVGLASVVSGDYYLPDLSVDRALPSLELAALVANGDARVGGNVASALASLTRRLKPGDRVLITGSFFTVAEALTVLQEQEKDLE